MVNFTSNTYQMKREILSFSNKISKHLSKPDKKFSADMTYGMLAAGSCLLTAMGEKFREFKLLRGGEGKVNPKITAYQVELAQVEAEIEKLLDTLTGANATLLAYANKKIEDLDNRRKTLSKAIADLSVETLSSQQIELLSGYPDDWKHISFEGKRKAADSLVSSISATSDYVKIEWKI